MSLQTNQIEVCYPKDSASSVPSVKDDTIVCTAPFTITVTCSYLTPDVTDITITSDQTAAHSLGNLRSQINSEESCFSDGGGIYWVTGPSTGFITSTISFTSTSNADTVIEITGDFFLLQQSQIEACFPKNTASTIPDGKDSTVACSAPFTITVTCSYLTPDVTDITITSDQAAAYSFDDLRNQINQYASCFTDLGAFYWTSGDLSGQKVNSISVTSTSNQDTSITIEDLQPHVLNEIEGCFLKNTAGSVPENKDSTVACTAAFTITVTETCTYEIATMDSITITSTYVDSFSLGDLRSRINQDESCFSAGGGIYWVHQQSLTSTISMTSASNTDTVLAIVHENFYGLQHNQVAACYPKYYTSAMPADQDDTIACSEPFTITVDCSFSEVTVENVVFQPEGWASLQLGDLKHDLSSIESCLLYSAKLYETCTLFGNDNEWDAQDEWSDSLYTVESESPLTISFNMDQIAGSKSACVCWEQPDDSLEYQSPQACINSFQVTNDCYRQVYPEQVENPLYSSLDLPLSYTDDSPQDGPKTFRLTTNSGQPVQVEGETRYIFEAIFELENVLAAISPCQLRDCQIQDQQRVELALLGGSSYALMIDTTDDGIDQIDDVIISCVADEDENGSTQQSSSPMSFVFSNLCQLDSTEVSMGGEDWEQGVDIAFVLDDDRGYNFTLPAGQSLNADCPIEEYEINVTSINVGRDDGQYSIEASEQTIQLVLENEPSTGVDLITITATARGGASVTSTVEVRYEVQSSLMAATEVAEFQSDVGSLIEFVMHVNLEGGQDEYVPIPAVTAGTRIVELQYSGNGTSPFEIDFVQLTDIRIVAVTSLVREISMDGFYEQVYDLELSLAKDDGQVETTVPVSITLLACHAHQMSEEGFCVETSEEEIEESVCQATFTTLPISNPDLCEEIGYNIQEMQDFKQADDVLSLAEIAQLEEIALTQGEEGVHSFMETKWQEIRLEVEEQQLSESKSSFAQTQLMQTLPEQQFNFTAFMGGNDFDRLREDMQSNAYPQFIQISELRMNQMGYMTIIFDEEINLPFFEQVKGKAPFELFGFSTQAKGKAITSDVAEENARLLETNQTDEEGEDLRDLRFSWYVNRASRIAIEIKLNFTQPIDVSRLAEGPDLLEVSFSPDELYQYYIFDQKILPSGDYGRRVTLTKQMEETAATQALSGGAESIMIGTQVLFWIGLIFQMLGDSALVILSLMIRTYQIVLHLPMTQLLVPPNVMMLFSNIIPIVCWDMLEGTVDWEAQNIFRYTKEEAPFPGQLEELGYGGSNWVLNTQTVAFVLFFITAKFVLYAILKSAQKCCNFANGSYINVFVEWLERTLFFQDLILITTETYIEFLIAGYLCYIKPHFQFYGDWVSIIYTGLTLGLAFVFMPLVIAKLWTKRYQVLRSPAFKRYFGAAYAQIRTRSRIVPFFLANVVIRRISLVSIGIFMREPEYMGLQWILVMIFVIIIPQIMIIKLSANKSLFENRIELLNEWIAGNLTILFLIFTDHYAIEIQLSTGWAVVIITLLGLLINILILVYKQCKTVYLPIKRCCNRRKHEQNIEKAPQYIKATIKELREPENKEKLNEYINQHQQVMIAKAKLESLITMDKVQREQGKGKHTRTIQGPDGPRIVHDVAYHKGDRNKPMADYGDEGNWDADSFKDEAFEDEQIENMVEAKVKQVRRHVYARIFKRRALERKVHGIPAPNMTVSLQKSLDLISEQAGESESSGSSQKSIKAEDEQDDQIITDDKRLPVRQAKIPEQRDSEPAGLPRVRFQEWENFDRDIDVSIDSDENVMIKDDEKLLQQMAPKIGKSPNMAYEQDFTAQKPAKSILKNNNRGKTKRRKSKANEERKTTVPKLPPLDQRTTNTGHFDDVLAEMSKPAAPTLRERVKAARAAKAAAREIEEEAKGPREEATPSPLREFRLRRVNEDDMAPGQVPTRPADVIAKVTREMKTGIPKRRQPRQRLTKLFSDTTQDQLVENDNQSQELQLTPVQDYSRMPSQ